MPSETVLMEIRSELLGRVDQSGPPPGCQSAAALIPLLAAYMKEHTRLWLSQEDVAFIFAVERTYCSRLFRSSTGKTFCEWSRGIRMKAAKELLQRSNGSVSSIALAVGYRDLTTFERNFRKVTGMCPTSFRRKRRRSGKSRRTKPR